MSPARALAILVAVAAILWIGYAVSAPLFDPDESRFARTSVEMLEAGDPVIPRFEGQPRLVKPPLLHWAQAGLFGLLGERAWVARLPAIGASILSLILLAWAAGNRLGDEAGPWVAGILLSMPLFFAEGVLGTMDALMSVHILAVIAVDLHPQRREIPLLSIFVGALLGMGFLAKGPVAVVLPLLMVLAGRTVSGRTLLPSWSEAGKALAAFLVMVLPWGAAFLGRLGTTEALAILTGETWTRFADGTDHVRPVTFYVPALTLAILPWCGVLLVSVVRALLPSHWGATRTGRYAVAAVAAGIAFFSLSKGKQATYLLPILPMAALAVLQELGLHWKAPERHRAAASFPAGTMAVIALLFAVVGAGQEAPFDLAYKAAAGLFGLGAAVAMGFWWKAWHRRSVATVIVTMLVFYALAGWTTLPELGRVRSAGPLVQAVPQLRGNRPVLVYDMKVPSLTFYLGRPPELVEPEDWPERRKNLGNALVVFDSNDWKRLSPAEQEGLSELGESGKYRVFDCRSCSQPE